MILFILIFKIYYVIIICYKKVIMFVIRFIYIKLYILYLYSEKIKKNRRIFRDKICGRLCPFSTMVYDVFTSIITIRSMLQMTGFAMNLLRSFVIVPWQSVHDMNESIRFGCFYELSRFSRTQQLKLLRALSHYHLRVMAMSQSYGKYD